MARSRGAVTGPLLVLLGVWGALIPFVGHYFSYGFTPDTAWHWTAARGWLEVLPGGVTVLAGALLSTTANRVTAVVASWLAIASGAWFVIGATLGPVWSAGFIGTPLGGSGRVVLERIGMFDGLGVVIVALAALALGRVTVVGLRDIAAVEARQEAVTTAEPTPSHVDAATVYPHTTSEPATTTTPAAPASYDKRIDLTDGSTTTTGSTVPATEPTTASTSPTTPPATGAGGRQI